MQPFDDEQISLFLDNWYNSRFADPQQAQRWKESLQKALGENDRIKLLARNPLLLTIIALIHRYQAVLPKQRNKLYEKAVDTLLVSWDKNKELSNHQRLKYLDIDDLKRLMELLAYWVHTQGTVGKNEEGGTVIDKDDLIEKLNQEIRELKELKLYQAQEETERFLELIQGRTGLLNEQGQDYYAFVHKTFQEYLCAQEIQYRAKNEYDLGVILNCIGENLHDAHWREVLLLLIVEQNPKAAAKAIRMILENGSEYEEWLHRDLLFAGYCLPENPKGMRKADSKLVQEILEKLVELEVSKEEQVGDKVRSQVFQILCSLGETDFEKQALEMLKERSDLIDEKRLLGYQVKLGEKDQVIPLFLEKLLEKKDYEPLFFWRFDSVAIFDQIWEDIVNALLPLLRDENSDVRGSAAYGLGFLGKSSEDVVNALLPLLRDENFNVRGSAALGLGFLGNSSEDIANALLPLLRDENFDVRMSAAYGLGNLGNSSEEVVNALLPLLHDEHSDVRGGAADALGKLGNSSEEVVNALLPLLHDEDSDVRWRTAFALCELGKSSENVINTLLLLLQDENSNMCWKAAFALGELGYSSEEVVNALLPLLHDEHSDVHDSAADALGKLGNGSEDVINALLPMLGDENYRVRWRAAGALGKLGKKSHKILLLPQVSQLIQKHQDSEYLGTSIDLLWDLLVGE
ncbi:HEAT repeat domain-containing protein [Okeania sp. SIO3I5]|uniref:HEAT repeat domain-containing protein n=1 Tax=Okeania sp. SIO3I5 TaxID=2607805 RepID=UPI0025F7653C|nr:HEAT repeat domain-containing protein [Okeania sp. SIO3I5]